MTSDESISAKEMFKDFVQIGVVVRDLEKAMKALSEVFGIGPFRTFTYPPPERKDIRLFYRGEESEFSHRLAFTEMGPIELELIQPLTGESTLTEFLNEHGEGVHHIRFNVPDVSPVIDYLNERGIKTTLSGDGLRPGTNWVHFDTQEEVGFTIEVMDVLPGTDGRTPRSLDEIS
jgi:methylmalonyl-CoA/ethylmalonyl-CoA epimerase